MLGADDGPGSNAVRFRARKERPGPETHGSGKDGSQREKSGENEGHLECSGWSGCRKGDVAAQLCSGCSI